MDGQYHQQQHQGGGYEEQREGPGGPIGGQGRDRRDEYAPHHQQHPQHPYQPSPVQSSAVPPESSSSAAQANNNGNTTNSNASPFAFAPPPLSRPPIPMSHSEPVGNYPYYNHPRPNLAPHNSYHYASSAPMGYRSYSNESSGARASPQTTTMNRTPSLNIVTSQSQASPTTTNSPYPYQRQVSNSGAPYSTNSPQRSHAYPGGPAPYYVPQAADMPRSLSYPSYSGGAYPPPGQYHHPPGTQLPALNRHSSTQGLEQGMGEMGMGTMHHRPTMGYSFANRLPLVDRPFKCDECVQSFNRNHDLKRHKRIHLAVKPFGCDKCGKTFSRKDALRRHWLVKGCRGEDGATAPIIPMFPINIARPAAMSPPSPPQGQISPVEAAQGYSSHSGQAAGPPAPLHTLPHRQSSGNDSQIIVTPDELAAQNSARHEPIIASLDHEPIMMDPGQAVNPGSQRSSGGSLGEGYFEGVVGIKQDGTAAMMDTPGGNNSPYSKYPASPSSAPQQYRRDVTLASPSQGTNSPTGAYMAPSGRSYSPSGLGRDGKPIFAMPFAPNQQQTAYAYQQGQDGLLGPPVEGVPMEKQGSADSDRGTWQRWHRPSFPFPPPPGVNYNFDPASPVDVTGSGGRPSFS